MNYYFDYAFFKPFGIRTFYVNKSVIDKAILVYQSICLYSQFLFNARVTNDVNIYL